MKDEYIKKIIESLMQANFYEALFNIKKLENSSTNNDALMLSYITHDLILWMATHKNISSKEHDNNKQRSFKKLCCSFKNKSDVYFQLFLFLNKNFKTFDHFTWFGKKQKLLELLNLSLAENPKNLETQFYKIFINKNINKCFDFLQKNTLNTKTVNYFLNNTSVYLDKNNLEPSKKLRDKYELNTERSDFLYYTKSKDYLWLYDFFNKNKENKYDDKLQYINFGETCFYLKKYDEAVRFYGGKNKNSGDFFTMGQCFEKIGKKDKAIECYKKIYFTEFVSGNPNQGIDAMFKLKAYKDIKYLFKKLENSAIMNNKLMFYKAKILYIEKLYKDSIEQLDNFLLLKKKSHTANIDKDVYFLYISNYYQLTILYMNNAYNGIINDKDFNMEGHHWINFNHYQGYRDLKKYIQKINIEHNNKYQKKCSQYKQRINNKYIKLHQNLYSKSKEVNFKLTTDMELVYLSYFNNQEKRNERVKIYKNRIKQEPENPNYNLKIGVVYFENGDYENAEIYFKKSIEFAKKYFTDLNGSPELYLIKTKRYSKKENESLFHNSMKDYIFHNSYKKNTQTIFFNQILYKYQSFSLNTLSSLSNNYLFFADPSKLNDPFDVNSIGLQKQYENLELDKNLFKNFCLTQNNNNRLMWSHYAQEHTGICIGYEFLYLPSYIGKEEIEYKNITLPEKDIFSYNLAYWTTKSDVWKYEKEIRLLHYGEEEKINYTFVENQAIQEKIIGLKIKSVTIGLKFKEFNILKPILQDIEKLQKSKIQTFKIYKDDQNLKVKPFS